MPVTMVNDEPQIDEIYMEDIENCTDINKLIDWYRDHTELAERLNQKVIANREGLAEFADLVWMRRTADKVGHLRVTSRHIANRIHALGGKPPYPPHDPRSAEIRRLNRVVEKAKRVFRSNSLDWDALVAKAV